MNCNAIRSSRLIRAAAKSLLAGAVIWATLVLLASAAHGEIFKTESGAPCRGNIGAGVYNVSIPS